MQSEKQQGSQGVGQERWMQEVSVMVDGGLPGWQEEVEQITFWQGKQHVEDLWRDQQ